MSTAIISDRGISQALFLLMLSIYLLTATYSIVQNPDTLASSLPAESLAREGDLDLSEYRFVLPPSDAGHWLCLSDGTILSNRPPGAWAINVPAAFMFRSDSWSQLVVSGAVTAAVTTAAAVALLFLSLRLILPIGPAVSASVLFGVGTASWSVAADALWLHGPSLFLISVAMYSVAKGRLWLAGMTLAASVLIRPQLAIIAAAIGLLLGWRRRSLRPILAFGIPGAAATAILITYNYALFGDPSPIAVYGQYVPRNVGNLNLGGFFSDIYAYTLDPLTGALILSPVLLLGFPRLVDAIRRSDEWVVVVGISGLVYLLAQLVISPFTGFPWNYRKQLETIFMAAPILAMGAASLWTTRIGRVLVVVAASASIAVTYLFATEFQVGRLADITYFGSDVCG